MQKQSGWPPFALFPPVRDDSFLKQRLRELFGVEGLQIVRLLAEADEFDGQAEFLLDRHDHAAFARAVELGHNQAGAPAVFISDASSAPIPSAAAASRLCPPRASCLPLERARFRVAPGCRKQRATAKDVWVQVDGPGRHWIE